MLLLDGGSGGGHSGMPNGRIGLFHRLVIFAKFLKLGFQCQRWAAGKVLAPGDVMVMKACVTLVVPQRVAEGRDG
jgi:hypothetical protein